MQKFSKKLVSKCIYIHILSSSTPELLELFLTQKGWDLLNAWFSDAYTSENYYLCGDLITLFSVCPMTSARLKENVEINQVNINFFLLLAILERDIDCHCIEACLSFI